MWEIGRHTNTIEQHKKFHDFFSFSFSHINFTRLRCWVLTSPTNSQTSIISFGCCVCISGTFGISNIFLLHFLFSVFSKQSFSSFLFRDSWRIFEKFTNCRLVDINDISSDIFLHRIKLQKFSETKQKHCWTLKIEWSKIQERKSQFKSLKTTRRAAANNFINHSSESNEEKKISSIPTNHFY